MKHKKTNIATVGGGVIAAWQHTRAMCRSFGSIQANRQEQNMDLLIGIISGQRSYALGLTELGGLQMVGSGVCNWQALISPLAQGAPAAEEPECIIYSFGISQETSFEEALSDKLDGRSRCQLFVFDPTVNGFPNQNIKGKKNFSKVALASKSDTGLEMVKGDLSSLMAERGHTHIDLLKVDIEGSEWELFRYLCDPVRSAHSFPFDQLLIELHGCSAELVGGLVTCLEQGGLYPFAREENFHGPACGLKGPPLDSSDVEMSFVRVPSRFTMAPNAQHYAALETSSKTPHPAAATPSATGSAFDPSPATLQFLRAYAGITTHTDLNHIPKGKSRAKSKSSPLFLGPSSADSPASASPSLGHQGGNGVATGLEAARSWFEARSEAALRERAVFVNKQTGAPLQDKPFTSSISPNNWKESNLALPQRACLCLGPFRTPRMVRGQSVGAGVASGWATNDGPSKPLGGAGVLRAAKQKPQARPPAPRQHGQNQPLSSLALANSTSSSSFHDAAAAAATTTNTCAVAAQGQARARSIAQALGCAALAPTHPLLHSQPHPLAGDGFERVEWATAAAPSKLSAVAGAAAGAGGAGSGGSEEVHHRILALDVVTEADWQNLAHAACASAATATAAAFPSRQHQSGAKPDKDDSLGDHGLQGSLSTRFDQLVLSLVLVGSDLRGSAAQARKDRDLKAAATATAAAAAALLPTVDITKPPWSWRRLSQEGEENKAKSKRGRDRDRHRRLHSSSSSSSSSGAHGKKKQLLENLVPGWAGPAAATLGPLVECLEADGFRLVHREALYDFVHEKAGHGNTTEPPLHAAALTLVQNHHHAAAPALAQK
eukprot:CAMPEP_0171897428 /NCGR_PEP_ID=MMETSP0992-20121227/48129_1 /TAXON_ID=483369 /ORGANISM="non described non described, Strain CCMP2098" /LENGTH=833 /DNA_ID=CAMNT_0012525553 /DNA_START=122 /DNA_END=2623 /DNA_ORIENTATION=+